MKWVGGKRRLAGQLAQRMPHTFGHYYEPFAGGAALFFHLQPHLSKAFLSDLNAELMLAYQVVQQQVKPLIKALQHHQRQHSEDYFYQLRSLHDLHNPVDRAARTIYLNKTCFNGLYRVNSKGVFNAPLGSYTNPQIVNPLQFHVCSKALQGVSLDCQDYKHIKPQSGDFVYFDPPYHSQNNTSFTAYTAQSFGEQQQLELAQFCQRLHQQGIRLMVSNHDTAFIRQLYRSKHFRIETMTAPRSISASGNSRQPVQEVVITNY